VILGLARAAGEILLDRGNIHHPEVDRTDKIFTNPEKKRTEDYVTGRFG
jgi:ABC-type phosphate transport system ATPase subunit